MKGIFQDKSPWLQFMILLFMAFAGAIIFSMLGVLLIPLFYPVSLEGVLEFIKSAEGETGVSILKFLQVFSAVGTFIIPAIICARLFSPAPGTYLRLNFFPKPAWAVVVLIIVLTLSGNSVSDILYRISKSFEWPEALNFIREIIESTESLMNEQMLKFLVMDTFADFLLVFFIMAILPAIGEEMLFRGAVQPVMKRMFGNRHIAVAITAILFAILHQQFYTFLSIFVLGLLLGYLKEWSRSLWVPMLLHLVNNGSIIAAVYFWDISYENSQNITEPLDWQYTVPSLLVFLFSLIALYRILKKKPATPEV